MENPVSTVRRAQFGGDVVGVAAVTPVRASTPAAGTACTPSAEVPARSVGHGGFDGRFSQEPEIIIAIPPALARAVIANRGWVFPLPPAILERVKGARR